jgi:hypothetical protein
MSKIPQGEWNAIAARYQNGESISRIARSYGCTPPAIHYILKRNRQRPGEGAAVADPPRSPEAAQPRLVRVNAAEPAPPTVAYVEKFTNGVSTAPQLVRASSQGSTPHAAFAAASGPRTVPPAMPLRTVAPQPATSPQPPAARIGGMPGLTSELHLRAEAAIELFRSSFDAALVEGSADVRERLRRAATDLMRVAARTTIVLDRLNASAERAARAHNYPRSAHAGDDLGNLG